MGYKKGARAERELAELLWERGYAVVRSAGSGNSYSPDVVAIKNGRVLAFECKAWRKEAIFVSSDQMEKMMEWRRRSGSELFLAWKYPYKGWLFVPIELLKRSSSGYLLTFGDALRFSQPVV